MSNGLYLKLTRTLLECTCEDLGCAIGLSRQMISNYEKGKTQITKATYLALCYIFEVENFHDFKNNKEAQYFFYMIDL